MNKDVIRIIKVKNSEEGFEICKTLLYENVSKISALFLSGGSTPKFLYEDLTKEQKLSVGAVALVDERYISKSESGTNEFMIRQTGFVQYVERLKTRFYPVLENKDIKETARDYDETVRYLFNYFQKSIGILGIGADGHTAGLPAGIQDLEFRMQNSELVTVIDDFPGEYKERISLTFLGISKLDLIIVLAFGKEKKKALKLMLKGGSIFETPARYFRNPEIARKTILITDQKI